MIEDIDIIISNILAGQATEEEEKVFYQWLEASGHNREHFEILKKTWQSKISYPQVINSNDAFDKLWHRHDGKAGHSGPSKFGFNWNLYLKAAAIFIFVVSISVAWQKAQKTSPQQKPLVFVEKKNSKGQKSKIFLKDGSFVWLNSDSKNPVPGRVWRRRAHSVPGR